MGAHGPPLLLTRASAALRRTPTPVAVSVLASAPCPARVSPRLLQSPSFAHITAALVRPSAEGCALSEEVGSQVAT